MFPRENRKKPAAVLLFLAFDSRGARFSAALRCKVIRWQYCVQGNLGELCTGAGSGTRVDGR